MYMAQYELKKTSLHPFPLAGISESAQVRQISNKKLQRYLFPIKLFNFGHYQVKKDAEHNR